MNRSDLISSVCCLFWIFAVVSSVSLQNAFPNVEIFHPVGMEMDPVSDNKFYVLSQPGIVYIVEKNSTQTNDTNLNQTQVFLNITDRTVGGVFEPDERGILGLAFHPNFTQNRYVYIYYTGPPSNIFSFMTSYLSRFNVTEDGIADPDSEFVMLRVDQPFPNHNGGQIKFGPQDGMLYIALGDGGSAGDPYNIAQNLGNILGKILRINVDTQDAAFFNESQTLISSTTFRVYGIPQDNPFAEGDAILVQPEIWAYGLRNPWRFSFDRETGEMWSSDAGQDRLEEINIIEKGGNYGWRIKEGDACFIPPSNCTSSGGSLFFTLTDPIYTYNHTDFNPNTLDSVVIGGYVYRGSRIPSLVGKYVFGDTPRGFIHALNYNPINGSEPTVEVIVEEGFSVSSFAEDKDGELYALNYASGQIFQFVDGDV